MKKIGLLKSLTIVGLSMLLVANLGSSVFAADDSSYGDWTNPTSSVTATPTPTSSTAGWNTTTTSTPTPTSGLTTTLTPTPTTSALTTTSTPTPTRVSLNTANNAANTTGVNNLAYTGASNGSIIAVMIVLGIGVAAYSFKKVKEYNNL